MGIINRITMLILMPIFGINQGAQPIIGYNYGAHNYDRVKKALKLAIAAATVVITTGYAFIMGIPQLMIGLFTHDSSLIHFASRAIRIFTALFPVVGFQIVSANYFQAVGKPRQAMFLSLSRQVVLLIPALFILPLFWGLDGVFMAGPFSDLGSAILTAIWLYRELEHLDERYEAKMAQLK
jgi:Na+-driven multidrug efflux pump